MLLLAAVIGQYAWFALDNLDDVGLQIQAKQITENLRIANGKVTIQLPPSLDTAYRESDENYLYAVIDKQGIVLAASSDKARRIFSGLSTDRRSGSEAYFRILDPDHNNAPYYALITSVNGAGEFLVLVAQGHAHGDVYIDSLLSEFATHIGWTLPVVLLAALFISIWTIRSSLKPINDLSARALMIRPETRAVRLPTTEVAVEILPLLTAINSALDRLESGFEVQRRFTANAAHELRTPLAVLTARLDDLEPSPTTRQLAEDIARMSRLVAQLLLVSRLEATTLKFEEIDLNRIAENVIGFLAPLAIAAGKSLALYPADGPVRVRGAPDALEDALRNLVENAISKTATGSEVAVTVTRDGRIAVRDHGPGVPTDLRAQVFERFWRGRERGNQGAGLGLAIVAETMRAHGGSVAVEDAAGGGAIFTMTVPLAGASAGKTLESHS